MLMVNELIGFGSVANELSIALLQISGEVTSATGIMTFSSQNFGAIAANRVLIACISYTDEDVSSLSSVTIGGVSAAIVATTQENRCASGIAVALVPTGASGNVVTNCDSAGQSGRVALYRAENLVSMAAFDFDDDVTDPASETINVPAGGFVLGVTCFHSQSAVTTTGLTEDGEANFTGLGAQGRYVFASQFGLAAETGRSVGFDGGTGFAASVFASFR